jgi:hypothetical protein
MAASMKITAFWDIVQRSLVKEYRHFRGAHPADDEGSMHLRNGGLLQKDYMVLFPRRL